MPVDCVQRGQICNRRYQIPSPSSSDQLLMRCDRLGGGQCWCDTSRAGPARRTASLRCRADRPVVKAQTSSVSGWHLLSSAASPPQFNSEEPPPSLFPLVSTLSWSEELCLFPSIFSLYLQCSSYRALTLFPLIAPSASHLSQSRPLHFVSLSLTHSLFF